MGKQGKNKGDQPADRTGFGDPDVQAHVPTEIPRQTPAQAAAQDEPPDPPELLAARGLMGTPKVAVIGGHTGIVFLTDYDIASNSYDGEFHRNRSMNTGDTLPAVTSVHGLRPYSPDSRSELVFVECGTDTSVIRNLQRRLQAR
jgi:hypothetical protein